MKSIFTFLAIALFSFCTHAQTSFAVDVKEGKPVLTQVEVKAQVVSSADLERQIQQIDGQITTLTQDRATIVALLAKVKEAEAQIKADAEKPADTAAVPKKD